MSVVGTLQYARMLAECYYICWLYILPANVLFIFVKALKHINFDLCVP